MVQYKLYYFNIRGRAELIRLLFAAAGEKYEDVRFSSEKWPEYKVKAPFGQCPYIEIIDGSNINVMSETIAIVRYLARKFGLYGKDDLEAGFLDMYADLLSDLGAEMVNVRREKDDEKRKELAEKLYKEIIPNQVKYIDERLGKSGSGFIVSSGFSWVDLYLYLVIDWIPEKESLLEKFKNVRENFNKVVSIPGIANWLKIRPVTQD